jgi:hypothetical protein
MQEIFAIKNIRDGIYQIRGLQVMLDSELSEIYGIETKVFKQVVKRNQARFPEPFHFQLTVDEYQSLIIRQYHCCALMR